MPEYTVRQGDSIASIAHDHGLHWQTIWDHPNNAELKERREKPNVLYPGDIVFVPDRGEKEVSASTGQRHRFRIKGVPEMLRMRLLDEDNEPRANVPYVLDIDGNVYRGTTNSNGMIERPVPPNARNGRLIVEGTEDEDEEEYQLNLGHLDPAAEISGLQNRLSNLGFYRARNDAEGEMGPDTIAALKEFQRKHDLPETGELDDATRAQLQDLHQA